MNRTLSLLQSPSLAFARTVGIVLLCLSGASAYEVEFDRIDGKSLPLATLAPGDIRLVTDREVELARRTAEAAK